MFQVKSCHYGLTFRNLKVIHVSDVIYSLLINYSSPAYFEAMMIYCREIMHAMWKPQKFKYIYLYATLYVFTLTIPSAAAMYWAYGDQLLNNANAFALLPKNGFRDAAVILMLIHQVFT